MNVGDYVRTKNGIAKIIDLKENPYGEKTIYILNKSIINIYDCEGSELACCNPFVEDMQDRFDTKFGDEKCIIKSSPNIIELFEEHDLVAIEYYSLRYKERITRLFEVDYKDKEFMTIKNAYCDFMLRNNEFNDEDKKLKPIIKSIVTHEQFESMEYKVGE